MTTHTQWWKNQKILIITGLVTTAAIVLVGSLWLMYGKADNTLLPTFIDTRQAQVLPHSDKCLVNNAALKTRAEKQKGLGEEDGLWTSYIYDVPAGTNVDVSISSYDEGKGIITGSLAYPEQYGSYNFTLTKHMDIWSYSKFTGCK